MHRRSPINSWETPKLLGVMRRFARLNAVLEVIGIKAVACKSSEWKRETISRPLSWDTGFEFPTFAPADQSQKAPPLHCAHRHRQRHNIPITPKEK